MNMLRVVKVAQWVKAFVTQAWRPELSPPTQMKTDRKNKLHQVLVAHTFNPWTQGHHGLCEIKSVYKVI